MPRRAPRVLFSCWIRAAQASASVGPSLPPPAGEKPPAAEVTPGSAPRPGPELGRHSHPRAWKVLEHFQIPRPDGKFKSGAERFTCACSKSNVNHDDNAGKRLHSAPLLTGQAQEPHTGDERRVSSSRLRKSPPARPGAQGRSSGSGVPHGVFQLRRGRVVGPRGGWRVESFLRLSSAARSLTRAIGASGSDLRELQRSFQNQHRCQAKLKAHGALRGKTSRSLSPSARGRGRCTVTARRGRPVSFPCAARRGRACAPGWGSQSLCRE